MNKYQIKTIKSLIGIILFSSTLVFNINFVAAAYSADTLVTATNSARTQNGIGTLSTNSALSSAAYAKANDILSNDYFAHNSPDGKTPWDFINSASYSYTYAGENLAIGYSDANELFTSWMNSPTHRENILNPNFREIGIAVVSGDFQGTQTIVAVQEFGAPAAPSAAVASESATPTPATSVSPNTTATPESNQVALNNQNKTQGFTFVKEKSDFNPKSIFAGEEVEFIVTISGEVKTLEATVFNKKYNLLETGTVNSSGKEKTYKLKQKIEDIGSSKVEIQGIDDNGNSVSLDLGKLDTKKTLITKAQTENKVGLIAGFQESFVNHWLIYVLSAIMLIALIFVYFAFKKHKFNDLLASWRF